MRPYRGLLPFREQDAGLFFGRQRFIEKLMAKVRQRSATNVVAVLGRSGSGKSSIVFAGLFPALRQEQGAGQQAVWKIVGLRPGSRAAAGTDRGLRPARAGLGPTQKLALINAGADLLRQRKVTLAQLVRDRIKEDHGTTRLLLYVDQWEELYTQAQKREVQTEEDKARAADARLFVDLVLDAAAKAPCTLVLSVRSDFYPDLQTHDALRAAVQDCQVSLGPMTADELTAAIEGPAKAVGGSVEPELTGRLLRDIGLDPSDRRDDQYDIGKLPLLEYALEQAWTKAERGRIGLGQYARPGAGARGARQPDLRPAFPGAAGSGQEPVRQPRHARRGSRGHARPDRAWVRTATLRRRPRPSPAATPASSSPATTPAAVWSRSATRP